MSKTHLAHTPRCAASANCPFCHELHLRGTNGAFGPPSPRIFHCNPARRRGYEQRRIHGNAPTPFPYMSTSDSHDCGKCTLHDAMNTPAAVERRDFLRLAGVALASLGFASLRPAAALAMPVVSGGAIASKPGDAKSEKRYPVPAVDGTCRRAPAALPPASRP